MERYPLSWPANYPRTKYPKQSKFGSVTFAKARDTLFSQLHLLVDYDKRRTIILSTNIPLNTKDLPYSNWRQPDDKGVAVYFEFIGEPHVICVDAWNKIEHNIWALAKTIEAMRGINRWGASSFLKQAFAGFKALPKPPPPPTPKRDWWQVLNYSQQPGRAPWDKAGVDAQYKSLAKLRHPDAGGTTEKFQELNQAYQEAKKYYS